MRLTLEGVQNACDFAKAYKAAGHRAAQKPSAQVLKLAATQAKALHGSKVGAVCGRADGRAGSTSAM